MASHTVSKFLPLRRLSNLVRPRPPPSSSQMACASRISSSILPVASRESNLSAPHVHVTAFFAYRGFCSHPSKLVEESQVPATINYCSVLQEDEFHKLADSTIHSLLEQLEEYGDSVEIDGFDIDYGNEVLTLKLGNSGTYVVNKQTPNRQIWLSSPVSGPSRYDWDANAQAWIYRRNKANLLRLLESELEKLCGQPLNLS